MWLSIFEVNRNVHSTRETFAGSELNASRADRDLATAPLSCVLRLLVLASVLALCASGSSSELFAQGGVAGWETGLDTSAGKQTAAPAQNTTVVPRLAAPDAVLDPSVPQGDGSFGDVRLVALLSEGSSKIERGLVWRVFEHGVDASARSKLLSTKKSASPVIRLKPGKYAVNVAFGRAYLTRIITVRAGIETAEKFILYAGGLKLLAMVDGVQAPKNSVRYDILEGEADQSGERRTVIAKAQPGLIIRLNAGIYRIISRYGDANALVSADVQVEAGKLSVASVSHTAATVTFKLVDRPGGEALPGIQWSIATPQGEVIKKSVGALPTHILAPGTYQVTAISTTGTFMAEFAIEAGQKASVEVVMN